MRITALRGRERGDGRDDHGQRLALVQRLLGQAVPVGWEHPSRPCTGRRARGTGAARRPGRRRPQGGERDGARLAHATRLGGVDDDPRDPRPSEERPSKPSSPRITPTQPPARPPRRSRVCGRAPARPRASWRGSDRRVGRRRARRRRAGETGAPLPLAALSSSVPACAAATLPASRRGAQATGRVLCSKPIDRPVPAAPESPSFPAYRGRRRDRRDRAHDAGHLPLREVAPAVSTGVLYLLAVLLVSTLWGTWLGVATAVASALAWGFFHLPPTGRFTIADPENLVALGVFLATAVVASTVADLVRAAAAEVPRRCGARTSSRPRCCGRCRTTCGRR